jgi:hypothetical protein
MSDAGFAQPPFEFPSQTKENMDLWEKQVNEALGRRGLRWSRAAEKQWILGGDCPRCGHRFTNYFDIEVVAARTFGVDTFEADKAAFMTEVVCLCEENPPHRKDTKGCGWGSGLDIEVPTPRET